jgi:hypothetical protein
VFGVLVSICRKLVAQIPFLQLLLILYFTFYSSMNKWNLIYQYSFFLDRAGGYLMTNLAGYSGISTAEP